VRMPERMPVDRRKGGAYACRIQFACADCLKRVVFPDTRRIPVLPLTARLNANGGPGMPERLAGVAEVPGDWLLFLVCQSACDSTSLRHAKCQSSS
jgi:hypothetical protein